MYISIGKNYTIKDLDGHVQINIGEYRPKTKICIIDDEIFPHTKFLNSHDYSVKEIGDINDIKAVEAYKIILCDIKGVGKSFNSKYEGGHIIEEINKYYPNKIIVAYTGERFDPTYNKFFLIADQSMKKDADGEQWLSVLDSMIEIANSPIAQWKKTRNKLLDLNISSFELIQLEHLFVQSYLEKEDKISKNKIINKLNPDIKTIILNLISSALFIMMIG